MTDITHNKLAAWATGSTGTEPTDMLYRSFVEGPQGAKFELLKEEHHTRADIKRAEAHLRANFDVVSIWVKEESEIV